MTYNPYFLYRQQVLERNNTNKKTSVEMAIDEKPAESSSIDGIVVEPAATGKQDKPAGAGQGEAKAQALTDKPIGNTGLRGFEQLGPGIYRFKHPSGVAPAIVPSPGHHSSTTRQRALQRGTSDRRDETIEFVRVDDLTDVYSNWGMPVYQFT